MDHGTFFSFVCPHRPRANPTGWRAVDTTGHGPVSSRRRGSPYSKPAEPEHIRLVHSSRRPLVRAGKPEAALERGRAAEKPPRRGPHRAIKSGDDSAASPDPIRLIQPPRVPDPGFLEACRGLGGAYSRSCCCCFHLSPARWSIGAARGGMDGSFGPQERILWPASVLAGVVMCGVAYEMTRKVSSRCFKGYSRLSHMQKVEWNNRAFSTFHALVAAAISFYLVVISDLFNEDVNNGVIIDRKSWLSDAMFGVSIGYFLIDLAMILWYFPSLGGKEYLLHHGLSMYAIGLALLSGKAHMYILMVLFTEVTTPFVNLRWYLDVSGQKNCNLYLYNGVALFVGWLVARIILFVYLFAHLYFRYDQVYVALQIFILSFCTNKLGRAEM
ncbi:hypothetical protein PVAP13_5NG557900 [Panicum virgatum]|uniref:TLC domain-containing protein n=1 Tax=Panicum virgatum TaxID=38727 RepID=A0A8T0S3K6_PANVG|nr:hypothetical protein PVAP13_5NG557900 [Panicum virgatum]